MFTLKKNGNVISAYDTDGIKVGTLSLKTGKFWGATKCWNTLREFANSFRESRCYTIEYKGKNYPVRTFVVELEGDKHTYKIATEALSEAMGMDNMLEDGTPEHGIDNTIYFYVDTDKIGFDAREICADYLDEPMKFIEEV